jgi:purine-nucleoside phosphorylase
LSSLLEQLVESAKFIQSKTKLRPQLGLVLGSGLGAFADSLKDAVRVPFREIPHFAHSTAIGHKGELVIGTVEGIPVALMNGRVHFYEGYTIQQVVFPIRVLGKLGVKIAILTNAAGAVNVNFKPGELMLITDHINFMGTNPMIGPNEETLGLRFFDMTEPYDPKLREIAEKVCWKAGVTIRSGVYIAFTGPSYETPAEIRASRTLGADAVGMSTVPEVIAARHMGIRVLGISALTNPAAGVVKRPLHHQEVLDVGEKLKSSLMDVLSRVIVEAAKTL